MIYAVNRPNSLSRFHRVAVELSYVKLDCRPHIVQQRKIAQWWPSWIEIFHHAKLTDETRSPDMT